MSDAVDFLHAVKHESLLQIDTIILIKMVKYSRSSQNSKFALSLKYLKVEVRDEVDFLDADKHQSFLQVNCNTLDIKVFYKVILSLLMGMICHSQSTQSEYLYNISKKKLGMEFSKLALSFFMEVSRHVQSTQNRKLVKFLQYVKKSNVTAFVSHCDAKHSDTLQGSSHVCCYLF